MTKYFSKLLERPDGFQNFEKEPLDVVGIQYRKDDAILFIHDAAMEKGWLEFEPEPTNTHDPNAIRVIGCTESTRRFVGYVPADIALQIAETGFSDRVIPLLYHVYLGEKGDGYCEISFQLLGPRGQKKVYEDFTPETPR